MEMEGPQWTLEFRLRTWNWDLGLGLGFGTYDFDLTIFLSLISSLDLALCSMYEVVEGNNTAGYSLDDD